MILAIKRDLPTRDALRAAALEVAGRVGVRAASVRAIARAAGVTEAALYRHYPSKDALYLELYRDLVADMAREKQTLARMEAPARSKLREWVRLTFEYFDRSPDAFAYVLLDDCPAAESSEESGPQSQLFASLVRDAQARGEFAPMDPTLASVLFSGLMLSVPRRIREGSIPGPASGYADAVADGAWRLLRSGSN